MDERTLHEVRQWLLKADHDLRSAALLMSVDDEPLFDTAVYHCQQTAEKSFKAYLTARGNASADCDVDVAVVVDGLSGGFLLPDHYCGKLEEKLMIGLNRFLLIKGKMIGTSCLK
jgi:hypothetical protein